MGYDEELADRIRMVVADEPALTEQRMFGGLAFLIDGHVAVAASGQGGLLVRCAATQSGVLVESGARPAVMRGREMPGWLRVDPEQLEAPADLARWVRVGTDYARGLIPKPRSSR